MIKRFLKKNTKNRSFEQFSNKTIQKDMLLLKKHTNQSIEYAKNTKPSWRWVLINAVLFRLM
ncbi:hypothetical protein PALB_100 [Pseudoalteromonas luteoviolacea B = ATCC 29581]|nr:hypothetical protein PALB_100 [Pseudoalteromonas luteoviolacea B = ATCC 29581]